MNITEPRTRELLQWLDDRAGDHTLSFDDMIHYRDAAALIRQLQADEQAAWHAGLDAGREQGNAALRQAHKDYGCELADPNGTIWDHAANLQREVEALRAEAAAQRTRADAMAGEAIKHEARAERLAEALREARNIAMEWTVRGRVPECGKFGEIAQDLDALLSDQEEGK